MAVFSTVSTDMLKLARVKLALRSVPVFAGVLHPIGLNFEARVLIDEGTKTRIPLLVSASILATGFIVERVVCNTELVVLFAQTKIFKQGKASRLVIETNDGFIIIAAASIRQKFKIIEKFRKRRSVLSKELIGKI